MQENKKTEGQEYEREKKCKKELDINKHNVKSQMVI
jgi:hypothetical protein